MHRAFKNPSISHALIFALLLQFIHSSRVANGQCDVWQPMQATGYYVRGLQIHNGYLYIGGYLCTEPICGVARWNGLTWEFLDFYDVAYELTVFNGDLIAGGFSQIGRWDGMKWQIWDTNGIVEAVCVYNDQLYAGGDFTMIGNVQANRIARWDGTSWHAMGTGLAHPNFDASVYTLAVYEDELIVGGYFATVNGFSSPMIAKWDGKAWHAMPGAPNSSVVGLHIHDGDLIVCGAFQTIGGIQVNRIARWNEMGWSGLGAGMNGSVWGTATFHGQLFAVGSFSTAGSQSAARIARWNGFDWQPLGSGLDGIGVCMMELDDKLLVGGDFDYAGGVASNSLALWRNYPCNDNCVSAPFVGAGSLNFGTIDATTDGPNEPQSCDAIGSGVYNDIWYKFLAPCTGTATVGLCGATFDTKIAVYGACPSAPGQAIACNEDFCGTSSQVSFAVNAGTLYRIRIGSATGEMGTGTMVIACAPTPPPCPADINGDQQVNVSDLLAVINAWGACPAPCSMDLNSDGMVNVTDLLGVINAWGMCP